MEKRTIGFIGGGNMATSLIGGLIADGCPSEQLRVFEPDADCRAALAARYPLTFCGSNSELVEQCDVVVLAVKPQVLKSVCEEIAPIAASSAPLFLSVAAGIRIADIDRWLGGGNPIVRTMPNTPALIQAGASALCANALVSTEQHELAEGIMRAVGLAIWIEEERHIDAVTALSGSGPAYIFLVIEAMQAAGEKLGLPGESARLLALQTAFGASRMALESSEDAATLRQRVTSPGGTTERAIAIFEEGDLRGLFERALTGARDRASELAEQLGR